MYNDEFKFLFNVLGIVVLVIVTVLVVVYVIDKVTDKSMDKTTLETTLRMELIDARENLLYATQKIEELNTTVVELTKENSMLKCKCDMEQKKKEDIKNA